MSAETVARTIQFILAPVVMVTACGILLTGLLGRYAVLNERLRALAHERLDLLHAVRAGTTDPLATERLQEIDAQVPDLLRRHKREHDAVLSVYVAILIFLLDMFAIALAALANFGVLATVALYIFLGGVAALFVGIVLTAVEVRVSHAAVEYEARRVVELGK